MPCWSGMQEELGSSGVWGSRPFFFSFFFGQCVWIQFESGFGLGQEKKEKEREASPSTPASSPLPLFPPASLSPDLHEQLAVKERTVEGLSTVDVVKRAIDQWTRYVRPRGFVVQLLLWLRPP